MWSTKIYQRLERTNQWISKPAPPDIFLTIFSQPHGNSPRGLRHLGLMKAHLLSLGLAAFALTANASETLILKLEPDQRVVLAGENREVVLKVDLTAAKSKPSARRLPLNLAIVIDRSGSMGGAKMEKARQAASGLIDQLTSKDIVSVVAYHDRAETIWPASPVTEREDIKRRIEAIRPGGSTALYAGVETGAEQLARNFGSDRINRVILLSDGLANIGPSSTADLKDLGRRLAGRGYSVSTIGVGDDYNEDLMAGIAAASDANYYYVKDAEKLPEIFAKELGELVSITARSVRIEIICPDGVEPIELIGREEKFRGRKAVVELAPFASGQNRYVFLRCRVKSDKPVPSADLATVRLSYRDELNESKENAVDRAVQIAFTDKPKEAAASVNTAVAAEREIIVNALVKDQAIADADGGRAAAGAKKLKDNAARLLAAAPAAPPAERQKLEETAKSQIQQADDMETKGMSRGLRKEMQSDSYKTRNAKQ